MLAAAVLLVTLFRPVAQARISAPVRPEVLVVVDGSSSMDIRDTRKDVPSVVEAAIALGKLPPDSPGLLRALVSASDAMDAAAAAVENGSPESAAREQERVAQALAGVRAAAQEVNPAIPQDAMTGLASLGERQAALRSRIDGADPAATAASQRELAAELVGWKEQACNSILSVTDALKAEMAMVSRRELVDGALARTARAALDEVAALANVRWFRFADDLAEMPAPAQSLTTSPAPGASDVLVTRLGDALEAAIQRKGGQRTALVVVVTDGASNAGADPLQAAWRLRQRGIRLVTVGVGLPRPDDAGLRNLVVPDVVFANDIVPLRVQCWANGYEKRSTTLVVRLDGTEVARKTVTFSGQSQFEELPFKAARSGGTHSLEVSLLPLPGEAAVDDNTLRHSLRVLDDKIKVLYIEGTPRWEYRYIRAVLKRDPRIDVQFINTEGDRDLARASPEHLGRFPEKESQAFRYDLVILGDVRANTFTPTQLSLMERLVRDRGASLILLAGRKHAPAEYLDTPLAAMLPVRFDQEQWHEIGDDVHPVLTVEGRRSTVMSLERSESRNQALWSNVKPLNWVPPVTAAKPGAQVLAELSDAPQRARAYPLVAWHRYGAGKCMFIGTDQLWRLRARTGDTYHLKFWGQAVQFLALSRLLGDNRVVQLQTGRDVYALDEPVDIAASALSELYEPLSAPTFTAYVAPAGGGEPAAVTLKAMPGLPGMYHGLYSPRAAGRYRVSASADAEARDGSSPSRATRTGDSAASAAEFEVKSDSAERLETSMQRDLLVRMANTAGGRYLSLRELGLLPQTLEASSTRTFFTKDIDLWDNWLIAVVFVALVALEWGWRRNSNLA
jgi:hypothetical protein